MLIVQIDRIKCEQEGQEQDESAGSNRTYSRKADYWENNNRDSEPRERFAFCTNFREYVRRARIIDFTCWSAIIVAFGAIFAEL